MPRLSVCRNRWIRRLGFTHYDAYIIDSTGHAASYVPPNGHLADGTREDPPFVRGSAGHGSISEERFATTVAIRVLCIVCCTVTLGPPVGASTSYVSAPLGL